MATKSPAELAAIIAAAKAKLAARGVAVQALPKVADVIPSISTAVAAAADRPAGKPAWTWNAAQTTAINKGLNNDSFVLIGAAGTGKTTTLRGVITQMIEQHKLPMLRNGTQHLFIGTPGIVLVSFTRRAVRNIARQMPAQLKSHCLTIHKLLEFAPEVYEEETPSGEVIRKKRFTPSRHAANPLPEDLVTIVVDESSMVDLDLFDRLLDALPNKHRVQFIFLGDLNQLPPVYGHPILGQKLLQLPIVELTEVYRQALESPIIALALAVKNNNFSEFNKQVVEKWTKGKYQKKDGGNNLVTNPDGTPRWDYLKFDAREIREPVVIEAPGHGKITLHPHKKRTDTDVGLAHMQGWLQAQIERGTYDPNEDLVLCPWDKSFGAQELNKAIADKLSKMHKLQVWEVIAGIQKLYLAIGDKVLVSKQEAIITDIQVNPKYIGRRPRAPSIYLNRWGSTELGAAQDIEDELALSDSQVDEFLESLSMSDGDIQNQASHIVKVRLLDDEDEVLFLQTRGELNAMTFAYVITVHKAQGSECRRVFFLTHYCHSAMCFRELVYTAITRAAEELYVLMSPMMLDKAAKKPRIKGDTLQAKLDFYAERLKERLVEKEEE